MRRTTALQGCIAGPAIALIVCACERGSLHAGEQRWRPAPRCSTVLRDAAVDQRFPGDHWALLWLGGIRNDVLMCRRCPRVPCSP